MHGVRVVMVKNLCYFDLLCYTCLFSVIGGETRIEGHPERAPTTGQRLRPHGRCRTVERFTTSCRLAADSSEFFPESLGKLSRRRIDLPDRKAWPLLAYPTRQMVYTVRGVERYINAACSTWQSRTFLVETRETRVRQRRRSLLVLEPSNLQSALSPQDA